MLFDWVLFGLVGVLLAVPLVGVPRVLGAEVPVWLEAAVSTLIPGILIFFIPALRRSGATFGQRAVWLEPDWGTGSPTVGRRILRVSVALGWTALLTMGSLAPTTALGIGTPLAGLLAAVEVITVGVSGRRGIGPLLARTRFIDSRTATVEVTATPEKRGLSAP